MDLESAFPQSDTELLRRGQPFADPSPFGLNPNLGEGIGRAIDHLFSEQREDLHWCAELESNSGITAEYVFMRQILGMDLDYKREELKRYLLGQQKPDGSWGIAHAHPGDVSSTAENYLALRILGVAPDDRALLRAERYIRRHGGLEECRIFTRIFFAMFGLVPWESIPVIPPEFILVPPQSPINIYNLSSWARGTMVPLFIIFHHKPVFALPNGKSARNTYLDHLWLNPADKNVPYRMYDKPLKAIFSGTDFALKVYERFPLPMLRKHAVKKCERWVLQHQEKSGDWAGIFPPMLNGVIALHLQGHPIDSGPVKAGLDAIERFAWEDARGFRIQACVSPVWDTVLSTIAMIDCGVERQDSRLQGAMDWILKHQILVDYGDWKVYNPTLKSGGWAFEYENSWYPDVDDTAAVILALLKQDPAAALGKPLLRAIEWTLGMQNRDGGWAAFDTNNDRLFLNEIPFSDMNSLCDPSSPDVTGRVLECFGLFLECARAANRELEAQGERPIKTHRLFHQLTRSIASGIEYLNRTQEAQGSWFGRWGVNYLYGTSNVLCGLARVQVPANDPMVEIALEWLTQCQNADGGWGEGLESYSDKRWMGKGPSTASQTAWALMGLLAYLPPETPAIERGVQWLLRHQVAAPDGGTWNEAEFTGTGFPEHFYLRYHLYRHYFPMMALGRYHRARLC